MSYHYEMEQKGTENSNSSLKLSKQAADFIKSVSNAYRVCEQVISREQSKYLHSCVCR